MRKILALSITALMISSIFFFTMENNTENLTSGNDSKSTSSRQLSYAGCDTWVTTTIDGHGPHNVGFNPSADIDSNDVVHTSYWDWTDKQLKYAEISNMGAQYSVEVVDSMPNYNTGEIQDLVVDMYDNIHIVYVSTNITNTNDNTLKHATKLAGSNSWTISDIDTNQSLRYVVIDSNDMGDLHIAYTRDNYLWHGKLSASSSSWSLTQVTTTDNVHGVDIAIDPTSNEPFISYNHMYNYPGELFVAKVSAGSYTLESVNVATNDYFGFDNDIEFTSTGPQIVYSVQNNQEILLAEYVSNQWVTSGIFVGQTGVSMAIDSGDNPHIMWHVDGVDEIRYGQFDSTGASLDTILDYEGVGQMDNELDSNDIPHVVYWGNNTDLQYATCFDSTNNPPSITPCDIDVIPGQVWDATIEVSSGDVYEYPANSGEYYVVDIQGYVDQIVNAPDLDPSVWSDEPCKCIDIWIDSGMPTYDPNINYMPGNIIEFPIGSNQVWMAILPALVAGVEPGQAWADDNDWLLCNAPNGDPCASFDGQTGGAWDYMVPVSTDDVFEYPANSGIFYQMWQPNHNNVLITVTPTEVNAYKYWSGPCTCDEIWQAGPGLVWSSNDLYTGNPMVEWPVGSQTIWYNNELGGVGPIPTTTGEPGIDVHWIKCVPNPVSGGPCSGFNGSIPTSVWDPSMTVAVGDVYEYPANSQLYYMVWHVDPNSMVATAPDQPQGDEFWTKSCDCKDIWLDAGMPVWDTNTMYSEGMIVEWPAGSMILYIALDNTNNAEPGVDLLSWKLCTGGQMTGGGPCAGITSLGTWDPTVEVMFGEIYQYPVQSGIYYEVVNPLTQPTIVPSPTVDFDTWAPVLCPCNDTWVANGEPVWDVTQSYYPGNYVVEWPAGSNILWISEAGGLSSSVEPGSDPHWMPCESDKPSSDDGPCAGITVVGVWDPTVPVTTGEVYQYPVQSGIFYEVIMPGYVNQLTNPPPLDPDVWAVKACPCNDTWVANGEPVWDNTQSYYPGNYVVEWPANSGVLYISEGGGITGAGEPGLDGHWILCDKLKFDSDNNVDDKDKVEEDETDSIPAIGVFGTMVAVTVGFMIAARKD